MNVRRHAVLQKAFLSIHFFQAIFSKDQRRIERWLPLYEQEETIVEQIPAASRPPQMFVIPAAISILVNRSDVEQRIRQAQAYLAENPLVEDVGMWGPALARKLPPDLILETMEQSVDRGYFLRSAQATTPFYGTNPWPEKILRHPRYHELWERPGMAELAAARRANGWEDGLPLPVEGSSAAAASIAVLPFAALSDDASDEYFGKGVAEELLNALAKFPELESRCAYVGIFF